MVGRVWLDLQEVLIPREGRLLRPVTPRSLSTGGLEGMLEGTLG